MDLCTFLAISHFSIPESKADAVALDKSVCQVIAK